MTMIQSDYEKILVIPEVNDTPANANATTGKGANGAWITRTINDLVETITNYHNFSRSWANQYSIPRTIPPNSLDTSVILLDLTANKNHVISCSGSRIWRFTNIRLGSSGTILCKRVGVAPNSVDFQLGNPDFTTLTLLPINSWFVPMYDEVNDINYYPIWGENNNASQSLIKWQCLELRQMIIEVIPF